MRTALIRTLLIGLAVTPLSVSAVYAGEPQLNGMTQIGGMTQFSGELQNTGEPEKDTREPYTGKIRYSDEPEYPGQPQYTITPEEERAIEKSVSAANAQFNATRDPDLRYISVTDPELKAGYDDETGAFIYRMPNGASFSLTAPLGGISSEPVTLDAQKDTWIVSLLKDGVSVLEEPKRYNSVSEALAAVNDEKVLGAELAEEGEYLFHVRSSTLTRSSRQTFDSYPAVRYVKEDSPLWINEIFPPYGYEIDEASVNGTGVEIRDPGRLELKTDGRYEIHFKPLSKGLPEWVSVFKRDTTAPVLLFAQDITKGPVKTPVNFRPSEEGVKYEVTLNGEEISLYNGTAAADGEYKILVTDQTGNGNEYDFRIRLEEEAPVMIYLIIALAAIAAAAVVILSAHRRMRII